MKKILIASVIGLLMVAAGGGWYVMGHRRDPMQTAKAALQQGDVRAAGIELRTLLRNEPENAEAHALLSQVQIAQGDPVAAEKEIKRAGELNWPKPAVNTVLAQAYLAQSKWNEIQTDIPRSGTTPAETAYFLMVHAVAEHAKKDTKAAAATIAEAERVDPTNPEVEVSAARFAIDNNDRELAMKKLDRALELAPGRVDALSLKSQLLAAGGDRAGAIALLDRAIEAAPTSTLRLERANLYMAQGQQDKASADVETVLAKEPKNAAALYMRMVLLIRQGKFADADLVAQQLDPVINRFQRGLYFKAIIKANIGQVAQAEDSAISYVSRYPTDPDGVRLLGRVELMARRPGRAIPALVNLVNSSQADPETLDLLGRAYAMDGKQREAEQTFKRASTEAGSSATALARVATSRLQVGDLAGATTDLERSLDIAPAQPGANEALFAMALAMGDFDRAQQSLDRLRTQVGENQNVSYLTGMLKLARLDPQGALDQFRETARKFPDFIPAKINEAKILIQLNRRDEAETVLNEILAKNPASAEALSLLVGLLRDQNRGQDAIKVVERAREADPNNIGIIAGQADLFARLGDMPRALQTLESFKVDGKTPAGLLAPLARAQIALGQTDAAKSTVATWIEAQPNNIEAVRMQVGLFLQLKDVDSARQAAQQAVQKQPGNLALMELLLGVELQSKGADAALAMADQLRALPANMPAAALLKGDLLMGLRRYPDAVAAYSDEFKRGPSTALVLRLAGADRAAGNGKAADDELKLWLSAHPNDADVAQVLASSDIAARRLPDAERNLQIVLTQRPNDAIALNNLAWVYQEQGDKRARQAAQRAFLQTPTPEVGDTFGWILVSGGEAAKALPILQTAAAARPNNPSMKYHLAVALKDLNRRDEALAVLRPALEGTQDFDEKPAAQQLVSELSKPAK